MVFHGTSLYSTILYTYSVRRTLPRGGMYWVVHPRPPGDFPRPSRCPEGEILRSEGIQPNSSRFEAVYGHSLIINPSLGIRKYIPLERLEIYVFSPGLLSLTFYLLPASTFGEVLTFSPLCFFCRLCHNPFTFKFVSPLTLD